MKLEFAYQDTTRKLLSPHACAKFAQVVRSHASLGAFCGPQELLQFLRGRAPELADQRSVAVRGLLGLYQNKVTPLAGEILFAAYYPRLRAICREFRDELRNHELDERLAVVVAAFFEAAARTPLEVHSPTALILALKTRQLALRTLCRTNRVRRQEAPWTDLVCRTAGRTATPESALVFRETARALDDILACAEDKRSLHQARAIKPGRTATQRSGSLRKQLREANPAASEQELRCIHQRLRAQRSRARRATRHASQESLSQIRGYLDLWEQEGWQ